MPSVRGDPVDDQPDELCLVSVTILQPRDDAVVEVLPGDQATATTVQG